MTTHNINIIKKVAGVLLAGGKSTRTPVKNKCIMNIVGKPMISYIHEAVSQMVNSVFIVTNDTVKHEIQQIIQNATYINQSQPNGASRGTGDAMHKAINFINKNHKEYEYILVTPIDCPFITSETIKNLYENIENDNLLGSALYFNAKQSTHAYGKLMIDDDNNIIKCVEHVFDNGLCNSGIMLLKIDLLNKIIDEIKIQDNGEKYITDIFHIAYKNQTPIHGIKASLRECAGINSIKDFIYAERTMQSMIIKHLIDNDVMVYNPETVYISADTKISNKVIIHHNTHIGPNTTIEENVEILPYSYIENCHIKSGSKIGPMCYIRDNTQINENTTISGFAEIKNSTIGANTKAKHHCYIGDTTTGEKCNIGAGAVICNYDGINKYPTSLGDNVFVGSNVTLIAPIAIEHNCYIAAGSVITKNAKEKTLCVERSKEKHMENKKCAE